MTEGYLVLCIIFNLHLREGGIVLIDCFFVRIMYSLWSAPPHNSRVSC